MIQSCSVVVFFGWTRLSGRCQLPGRVDRAGWLAVSANLAATHHKDLEEDYGMQCYDVLCLDQKGAMVLATFWRFAQRKE